MTAGISMEELLAQLHLGIQVDERDQVMEVLGHPLLTLNSLSAAATEDLWWDVLRSPFVVDVEVVSQLLKRGLSANGVVEFGPARSSLANAFLRLDCAHQVPQLLAAGTSTHTQEDEGASTLSLALGSALENAWWDEPEGRRLLRQLWAAFDVPHNPHGGALVGQLAELVSQRYDYTEPQKTRTKLWRWLGRLVDEGVDVTVDPIRNDSALMHLLCQDLAMDEWPRRNRLVHALVLRGVDWSQEQRSSTDSVGDVELPLRQLTIRWVESLPPPSRTAPYSILGALHLWQALQASVAQGADPTRANSKGRSALGVVQRFAPHVMPQFLQQWKTPYEQAMPETGTERRRPRL